MIRLVATSSRDDVQTTRDVASTGCSTPRRARCGLSLLELIAVMTILGVVALVVVARNGQTTVRNLAAHGFARQLALDLRQAQQRAISTGDNHYLQFAVSGATVAGYQIYRRASGGDVAVDEAQTPAMGTDATVNNSVMEFDFTGAALGAYQATIVGPQQTWKVSVTMATGTVSVAQTP